MSAKWHQQAQNHEQQEQLVAYIQQWEQALPNKNGIFCIAQDSGAIGHFFAAGNSEDEEKPWQESYCCPLCNNMLFKMEDNFLNFYFKLDHMLATRKRSREHESNEYEKQAKKKQILVNHFNDGTDSLLTYCVKGNYLELASFVMHAMPFSAFPFARDVNGNDSPYDLAIALERVLFVRLFEQQRSNVVMDIEKTLVNMIGFAADEYMVAYLLNKSVEYVRMNFFPLQINVPMQLYPELLQFFCRRIFSYLLQLVTMDVWALHSKHYLQLYSQSCAAKKCKQLDLYKKVIEVLHCNAFNHTDTNIKERIVEMKVHGYHEESLQLELVNAIWKRKYSAKICKRAERALQHLPATHIYRIVLSSLYGKEQVCTDLLNVSPFIKYHIRCNISYHNKTNNWDHLKKCFTGMSWMRFKSLPIVQYNNKFVNNNKLAPKLIVLGMIVNSLHNSDCPDEFKYQFLSKMLEGSYVAGKAASRVLLFLLKQEALRNPSNLGNILSMVCKRITRLQDKRRALEELNTFCINFPDSCIHLMKEFVLHYGMFELVQTSTFKPISLFSQMVAQKYLRNISLDESESALVLSMKSKDLPHYESRIIRANLQLEKGPNSCAMLELCKSYFKIGKYHQSLACYKDNNIFLATLTSFLVHPYQDDISLYGMRSCIAIGNLLEFDLIAGNMQPLSPKQSVPYHIYKALYYALHQDHHNLDEAQKCLQVARNLYDFSIGNKPHIANVLDLVSTYIAACTEDYTVTWHQWHFMTTVEMRQFVDKYMPCAQRDWLVMLILSSRPFLKRVLQFTDIRIVCQDE